jgi:hypothetical protein
MRYRLDIALLASIAFLTQILLPLGALFLGGWAAAAGVLTYASIAAAYFANRKVTHASPWFALLFAPASAILLFAVVRSVILTLARGGVEWRGTRYPLAELKKHAGRNW